MSEWAETYVFPAYKWLGKGRKITNQHGHSIVNHPGGIGFKVRNYAPEKRIFVKINLYREDQTIENYMMKAYYVEHMSDDIEKWQTHQLVLFPYESPHGQVNFVTFSYLIHKDWQVLYSEFEYKYARREDFHWDNTPLDDFDEHPFKRHNHYRVWEIPYQDIQNAVDAIQKDPSPPYIRPFFTRGDPYSQNHPIHEIHNCLSIVEDIHNREPYRKHYVHMSIFNFENENIINHLLHLHSKGIEVECIGGWEQVSSADWSDQVARLRKSGIPVLGVVRNTPYSPNDGIASMHTKIIIFDGSISTSSSYNLDFHRWGGNWENGLFFYSPYISLLYEHVYQSIKGGIYRTVGINPDARYNLYYSFGKYNAYEGKLLSSGDAILKEIYCARSTIFISMFDLDDFYLNGPHSIGKNLVSALIEARNRGIYILILLNGFRAEREDTPVNYDLGQTRPLRPTIQHLIGNNIDILLLYYNDTPFSPLHHKFIIFDEHTIISESYNWYSASLYSDEVFSVIRDKNLADQFMNEMFYMIRHFRIRRGSEY